MLTRQDIEKYMREGTLAYTEGKTDKDNPYSKYGEAGRLWLRGLANAYFGDLHGR